MSDTNLKAKEMLADFLDTAFLLFLISFCVFYFIVGDHFDVAQKIAKAAFAFSWVGVIFMLKFKFAKVHIRKLVREGRENEIVAYYDKTDRLKDLLLILSYPILIIVIGLWKNNLDDVDVFQAIMIFFVAYFWHFNLFSPKEEVTRIMYATNLDKLKDEIFTFFLPFFIIIIAFSRGEVNDSDIVQALLIFFISYVKHKKVLFAGNSDFNV